MEKYRKDKTEEEHPSNEVPASCNANHKIQARTHRGLEGSAQTGRRPRNRQAKQDRGGPEDLPSRTLVSGFTPPPVITSSPRNIGCCRKQKDNDRP